MRSLKKKEPYTTSFIACEPILRRFLHGVLRQFSENASLRSRTHLLDDNQKNTTDTDIPVSDLVHVQSSPNLVSSSTTMTMIPAARTAIDAPSDRSLRVPCFCEENIWRLAYRHLYGVSSSSSSTNDTSSSSSSPSSSCWYVVFVSNPTGCVPMMQQLAAATSSGLNDRQKNQPVFWDYHVILVEKRRGGGRRTAAAAVTTEQQRTSSSSTTTGRSSSSSSSPLFPSYVWDIDSLLPCPCPIEEYLETSFSNHTNWPSKYRPFFRHVLFLFLLWLWL